VPAVFTITSVYNLAKRHFIYKTKNVQSRRHGGIWWAQSPKQSSNPPKLNYKLVEFWSNLYVQQGRSQDFSKGGAEVMEAKALKKKNCL